MEVYNSSFSAQDLENAIKAVPSIGENGNWWIGDTDTGVLAGGVNVTGVKVGHAIKASEVDDDGRPTVWSPTDRLADWTHLGKFEIEEEVARIEISTDKNGNSFSYRELSFAYSISRGESSTTTNGTLNYEYGGYVSFRQLVFGDRKACTMTGPIADLRFITSNPGSGWGDIQSTSAAYTYSMTNHIYYGNMINYDKYPFSKIVIRPASSTETIAPGSWIDIYIR